MKTKEQTCCFTGHRKLPEDRIEAIVSRLSCAVEGLIAQGVTNFISGGALGFDTIAASHIAQIKQQKSEVRLIFALPCRNQDERWNSEQKEVYHGLLAVTDEVNYISEEYYRGCMRKRNRYMIDNSAYCISALLYARSGTEQTVNYARMKGVSIIDVAKS